MSADISVNFARARKILDDTVPDLVENYKHFFRIKKKIWKHMRTFCNFPRKFTDFPGKFRKTSGNIKNFFREFKSISVKIVQKFQKINLFWKKMYGFSFFNIFCF